MWLEHLLFGAVIDTSFAVSCKALALYSKKVFLTYTVSAPQSAIVLRNIFSELKEDERRRRELPVGNDRLMSEV